MIGKGRRPVGIGYREISILYSFAIEHAEVATHWGRGPLPRTEGLLPANIDRQFRLFFYFVCPQEAGEAAKMIVMTVTEHHRIEAGRVDAYEVGVIDQR